MAQMEECLSQGKSLNAWIDYVEAYFYNNYDSFVTTCRGGKEERWYCGDKEGCFKVNAYSSPLCGFSTEFADSAETSDLLGAEDGDQYPLLDYDTPEDMLQAMLAEIE